jgi:UDP-N-acetyl-D-galactosamine dehydrogenase
MNDSMGEYVSGELVKLMLKSGKVVRDSKVLMLGITFKENCPDIRNTRAIDIYHELKNFGADVEVYDPWACSEVVKHEYGIELTNKLELEKYEAIILAVSHNQFLELDLTQVHQNGTIIFDCKGILDSTIIDGRL